MATEATIGGSPPSSEGEIFNDEMVTRAWLAKPKLAPPPRWFQTKETPWTNCAEQRLNLG